MNELKPAKAVILAGGKGTRLGLSELPKPMAMLSGKPILEHIIANLIDNDIRDILFITGYKSEVIEKYFGNGERFGANIQYYVETNPLGTAGALPLLTDRLAENFFVLYGDVMLAVDFSKMHEFHLQKNALATLAVHPNDHPYDSDLLATDETGKITAFYSKPHPKDSYFPNLVNAALYCFNRAFLQKFSGGKSIDFGKDVFPALIGSNRLFAYRTSEYLKDMGVPERLKKVEHDLESGKVSRWHSSRPRPVVFIDRDGVLNEDRPWIATPEDLEVFPYAALGLKKLNQSDFLAILVTNQPVVARGECSIAGLEKIHNKLETTLGADRAYLDRIYYCPHHPDSGFPGEVKALKIECECRKPGTGMLKRAAQDFHLDLKNAWFIGDSARDLECGERFGIRTIGVRTGKGCKDGDIKPNYWADNFLQAVEIILSEQRK